MHRLADMSRWRPVQRCLTTDQLRIIEATPAVLLPAAPGVQVQAGFAETRAVRRNNVNLLRLFLSRWLYATPLDLEALLKLLTAPTEEKAGLDRRQFGMQLLVLGATPALHSSSLLEGYRAASHTSPAIAVEQCCGFALQSGVLQPGWLAQVCGTTRVLPSYRRRASTQLSRQSCRRCGSRRVQVSL